MKKLALLSSAIVLALGTSTVFACHHAYHHCKMTTKAGTTARKNCMKAAHKCHTHKHDMKKAENNNSNNPAQPAAPALSQNTQPMTTGTETTPATKQ
jgi:hypothetical protein